MSRIEHFATYLQGGAGAAARRIFDGIRAEFVGHASIGSHLPGSTKPVLPMERERGWEFILRCRSDQQLMGEATQHFTPSDTFMNRTWSRRWHRRSFKQAAQQYHEHLKNRPSQYEVFSPARLFEPTAHSKGPTPDLIHLHWVAFLMDYQTFFRSIPSSVPVVWTLHDMNAFTGGCHYSAGCSKYLTGCGNCFQLDNPGNADLSAVAWKQKKRAYGNRKITIVSPCQWLTRLAEKSQMFHPETQFETIHYGLDTDVYRPEEKQAAKRKLKLDESCTTLLFGAADLAVERKGLGLLIDSLSQLHEPDKYQCVVFGSSDTAGDILGPLAKKMKVRELGYLSSDEEKQTAYSAADMFLLPSLEDNQPQTGLESLACGTPVVAFDAGGISEFVQHGKTGLLAEVRDTNNLAKQIRWLAESPDSRNSFGINGRNLILEEFEIGKQSKKYGLLYKRLIFNRQLSRQRAA